MSGRDVRYDRMDALEVLYRLRKGGARVLPDPDGGVELCGAAGLPPALIRRAWALSEELRAEVTGPASAGWCPCCCGRVFYRHDSLWHCLGCEGLPAGGTVPETFALTSPVEL